MHGVVASKNEQNNTVAYEAHQHTHTHKIGTSHCYLLAAVRAPVLDNLKVDKSVGIVIRMR